MRFEVSQASEYRPYYRADEPSPYPVPMPALPTVPDDIAAALHRVRTTPLPERPAPERPAIGWTEYLRFWRLRRRIREHQADEAERAQAFQMRQAAFDADIRVAKEWAGKVVEFERQRASLVERWRAAEQRWEQERREDIAAWEIVRTAYEARDPRGVENYLTACLQAVPAPQWCPHSFEIHFEPDERILIVEAQLPDMGALTIEKTRSPKSSVRRRGAETSETLVPASQKEAREFSDTVLYFLVLRVLWEVARVDRAGRVRLACCNGYVVHDDPATGRLRTDVIMSVAARPEELRTIVLERVDPKACFLGLKGVAAAKPVDLVPVTPVLQFDRADRRFVEGKEVLENVGGLNLATLEWQEFEHLIRELFEKEFAGDGAEVRVTQASRDRGVDAVVFDPDPLRGGKFVIQAKRYTNTVDVAAVRDLFGTVQAEGANKGILVTTSNYGRDSYDFAKGKPLTLLNGSNLLSLLEKHGYRARIDIAEAKRILGTSSQ